MKLHELKIKDEYYYAVSSGYKTFELRRNDRDFKVFDNIHFVNVNGHNFDCDSDNLYQITYVLKDCSDYGLDKDYCIFCIKKVA